MDNVSLNNMKLTYDRQDLSKYIDARVNISQMHDDNDVHSVGKCMKWLDMKKIPS